MRNDLGLVCSSSPPKQTAASVILIFVAGTQTCWHTPCNTSQIITAQISPKSSGVELDSALDGYLRTTFTAHRCFIDYIWELVDPLNTW